MHVLHTSELQNNYNIQLQYKVLTVFLCTNTYQYLGLRRAEIVF